MDFRQRRNPSHHGIATSELFCRGSTVPSRECANGRGEEIGEEFPRDILGLHYPHHFKGSKRGDRTPRAANASSAESTIFSNGFLSLVANSIRRDRPSPNMAGATIKRGRLVASGMAGSRFA